MRPRMRTQPPAEAEAFVGQYVRLRIKEFEVKPIGMVKQYKLDDPEMEAKLMALSSNVVILPPGYATTMNYDPFRLNISVDADGLISRVYMG